MGMGADEQQCSALQDGARSRTKAGPKRQARMFAKLFGRQNDDGNPAAMGPAQGMADCCARRIGAAELVECQSKQPAQCKFALSFGYSFFGRHPRKLEIAARTSAERKVA